MGQILFRSGGTGCHSNLRFCLLSVLFLALSARAYAKGPHGDFVCRQYSVWYEFTNVASMHLSDDGTFSAKDLTTNTPEVQGKFTFDTKTKAITWSSGIWATLLGHYVPDVSGTSLLLVTTKKDPEGKINGALRCIRVDAKTVK